MVDAQPVLDHVLMLSEAGLGKTRLAQLTGLSQTSIEKLKRGSKRVRKETADAIMAVEPWQAERTPKKLAQIGKNQKCIECELEPLFGGLRCLRHFQAKVRANRGEHGCLKHLPSVHCYRRCLCRCRDCKDVIRDLKREKRKSAA